MKHEINLWGFEPPNHRWDQDKNAKLDEQLRQLKSEINKLKKSSTN